MAILLINLVVAALVVLRRPGAAGWMLLVLLGGTSGAAIIAVGTLFLWPEAPRALDAALILVALAALAVLVRRAALRVHEDGSRR